jgi:hypothetical protein
MLTQQGQQNWQLASVYPDPQREKTRWVFAAASAPVQYNVVDQPWSPSDPSTTQAMLTQQGQAGWQLSAVWPDPQRERTRWIFFSPPAATGGGSGTPGTIVPNVDATPGVVGTSTAWSHEDHVHPTDTSRVAKSGDSMTGVLALAADPTAALQAATKQYVDAAVSPAFNDVGRNKLHNPLFNIQQRGAGPWSASGNYTLDRWRMWLTNDTFAIAAVALNDAGRAQIGDEAALSQAQAQFSGSATAGSHSVIIQSVESVRRLAGKTVTVSFWASASAAGLKLGAVLDQIFGTGGSPSANVSGTGQAVALSTTWTRYTLTFALPSAAGKVIGANGDDSTQLLFYFSAASDQTAHSGNVGVQSGTVNFWGVQLEIGSVATPLEKPDPQQDLAKCQRFYQVGGYSVLYTAIAAAGMMSFSSLLPVPMRVNPVWTATPGFTSNVSAPTIRGALSYVQVYGTAVAAGASEMDGTFTASADL